MKKSRIIVLSIFNLIMYFLIIYMVSSIYKTDFGESYGVLIQNITYIILAAIGLISMKLTNIPIRSYGIFFENFVRQILVGIILGIVLVLICCIFGMRPVIPSNIIYVFFIQLFVIALSEEIFWRGFIQECIGKILNSEIAAVLLSAFLFGIVHFFVSSNIAQVISGFIFGFIMGELRREFKDSVGLISLIIGHAIFNTF